MLSWLKQLFNNLYLESHLPILWLAAGAYGARLSGSIYFSMGVTESVGEFVNCIDSLYLCDSFFSVSACSFLCKIYRINSLLLYYYSWAVVIPRDARNPNKPQKFELAIYPAVEVTS